MPSVRASSRPNLNGWKPADLSPVDATNQPNPPSTPDPETREPFMHASMPLMASTNDALSQFYSDQNIPQQRVLPVRPGGAVL